MPNNISKHYPSYVSHKGRFEIFHNQVINMPRDSFSNTTLLKIQSMCAYLNLISDSFGELDYKEMLSKIRDKLSKNEFPSENFRNLDFEDKYFDTSIGINELYKKQGRMFRHFMEMLLFFGIIKNGYSKRRKILDKETVRTILLSNKNVLKDLFRNIMLNINIKNNSFFENLNGIEILNNADYHPVINILKYCKELNRPITFFEVSVLLGRIDEVQIDNKIFTRAVEIGTSLPLSQDEQIDFFFKKMGWKNSSGTIFSYTTSQEPYFKFRSFLIYLELFDFITIDYNNSYIFLTPSSNKLVDSTIPFALLDLENLLCKIDDDSSDINELSDLVLHKRTDEITKAIESDGELLEKFNLRSLRNPIIKNGKRTRNKLISELAKIKAKYLDEITGLPTFSGSFGTPYIEAHHIIEFSREKGPDITDNLVCLSPNNHNQIHHGDSLSKKSIYSQLLSSGATGFDKIKKMAEFYHCLTNEHVDCLYAKNLITIEQSKILKEIISREGIDSLFLETITKY